MKKRIWIICFFLCISFQIHSQEQQSAAQKFQEIQEKTGVKAALDWLADINPDKLDQYVFNEKEFIAIGKVIRSFGFVKESARFFKIVTKLLPRSSLIWETLGYTQVRLLQKDDAVASYKKAIEIDPNNRSALGQLQMIDVLLEDTRYETREKMRYKTGEMTGIKGPYLGQKLPRKKPELFAPGIISVFGSNENTVTLSPDGREIYFGKESGIWVCQLTENGWTAPKNTGFPGYEMWISPHNGKMYYTGYEPGIWVMERSGTEWGKPYKLVSKGMFSTLTRDEKLFTTFFDEKHEASIGFYEKLDGKYENTVILGPEINMPNCFDAHPNVAPDGSFIIFDSKRPEGNGLYISFKNKEGIWTTAKYMGDDYESASVSTLSPDGRYLFFMKHRDIYWVDAKIIEKLKPE